MFKKRKFYSSEYFGFKQFRPFNISPDDCISTDYHYSTEIKSGFYAHTHKCSNDKYFNFICIPEQFIKNLDGTPSDVLWHEYGHFLDSTKRECENIFGTWEDLQTLVHGDHYKHIMTVLGKPHLANRTVRAPGM